MNIPPNANPENEAIKRAFITTSVAMYLQAAHLQYEEEPEVTLLSYLIASANSGNSGNSAGKQSGSGQSGHGNTGNPGNKDDDDFDEKTNMGGSLVNNTGQVTTGSDFIGAGNIGVPRTEKDTTKEADEEENVASTSPGGTGDSRIIGGVNPEDDEIDWNNTVDEGTKDADAATG